MSLSCDATETLKLVHTGSVRTIGGCVLLVRFDRLGMGHFGGMQLPLYESKHLLYRAESDVTLPLVILELSSS